MAYRHRVICMVKFSIAFPQLGGTFEKKANSSEDLDFTYAKFLLWICGHRNSDSVTQPLKLDLGHMHVR